MGTDVGLSDIVVRGITQPPWTWSDLSKHAATSVHASSAASATPAATFDFRFPWANFYLSLVADTLASQRFDVSFAVQNATVVRMESYNTVGSVGPYSGPSSSPLVAVHFFCQANGVSAINATIALEGFDTVSFAFTKQCQFGSNRTFCSRQWITTIYNLHFGASAPCVYTIADPLAGFMIGTTPGGDANVVVRVAQMYCIPKTSCFSCLSDTLLLYAHAHCPDTPHPLCPLLTCLCALDTPRLLLLILLSACTPLVFC